MRFTVADGETIEVVLMPGAIVRRIEAEDAVPALATALHEVFRGLRSFPETPPDLAALVFLLVAGAGAGVWLAREDVATVTGLLVALAGGLIAVGAWALFVIFVSGIRAPSEMAASEAVKLGNANVRIGDLERRQHARGVQGMLHSEARLRARQVGEGKVVLRPSVYFENRLMTAALSVRVVRLTVITTDHEGESVETSLNETVPTVVPPGTPLDISPDTFPVVMRNQPVTIRIEYECAYGLIDSESRVRTGRTFEGIFRPKALEIVPVRDWDILAEQPHRFEEAGP